MTSPCEPIPLLVPRIERKAGEVRPSRNATCASSAMVSPSPPYSSGMDRPKRPSSRISATTSSGTRSSSATRCSSGRSRSVTKRSTVSRSWVSVSWSRAMRNGSALVEVEGLGQALDGPEAGARQGCEAVPVGDELQDRRRLVLGVVDVPLAGERRDDDGRNARTGTEEVGPVAGGAPLRRRDVVPQAAVLVVRDDDGEAVLHGALFHEPDDASELVVAGEEVGVAGVLVQHADGLVERHRRELARLDIGLERARVAQVRGTLVAALLP